MADDTPVPDSAAAELVRLMRPAKFVRAIDYMQAHAEPIDEHLWAQVYRISQQSKRESIRLKACAMFLDRVDPVPRAPAVEVQTGPVTITWKSVSTTAPDPSRPSSTLPSDSAVPAPPASSAIDVLANL